MSEGSDIVEARVHPGPGLVLRTDVLSAYVRSEDPAALQLVAQLERIQANGGTAAELLHLGAEGERAVSFAAAFVHPELDVVLCGDVLLRYVDGSGAVHHNRGGRPQLIALPSDVSEVSLIPDEGAPAAHEATALIRGVVQGGGIQLLLGEARSVMHSVVPPEIAERHRPEQDATGRWENLLEVDDGTDRDLAPLVVHASPTGPDEEDDIVEGLACSRNHINRRSARFCSSCGRRLQDTLVVRRGPRPSLGTLIFADGSTFALDRSYVLGRSPENDERIVSGRATIILLDDGDQVISRVHAEIRLEGWDVLLVDKESANGTFVRDDPNRAWERMMPGTSRRLMDGSQVGIGRRAFVFHER